MFQSKISGGAMEKLPEAKAPRKSETNTISSWSYDMEGHAKKCVERYCELANKNTMAKIMVRYGRSSCSSWTEFVRSSFGRTIVGRQFEQVLLEHGWEKIPNWECSFVNREKGLFLSVYVDDIKLAGRKQKMSPTWKIQMKDVYLGEPTSFLDHV